MQIVTCTSSSSLHRRHTSLSFGIIINTFPLKVSVTSRACCSLLRLLSVDFWGYMGFHVECCYSERALYDTAYFNILPVFNKSDLRHRGYVYFIHTACTHSFFFSALINACISVHISVGGIIVTIGAVELIMEIIVTQHSDYIMSLP